MAEPKPKAATAVLDVPFHLPGVGGLVPKQRVLLSRTLADSDSVKEAVSAGALRLSEIKKDEDLTEVFDLPPELPVATGDESPPTPPASGEGSTDAGDGTDA